MSNDYTNEPMIEMFVFETTQQIEQLEKYILSSEKDQGFSKEAINDIFRIMHTIKGSAAMMLFQDISSLAHSIEDIFFFIREENPTNINYSYLSDLLLDGIDFIKIEIEKINNGDPVDGNAKSLIESYKELLAVIKKDNNSNSKDIPSDTDEKPLDSNEEATVSSDNVQYYIMKNKEAEKSFSNSYKAIIYFADGCEMENIRAYTIIHNLKEFANEITYIPADIIDSDESSEFIRKNGFTIFFKSDDNYDKINEFLQNTIFLKDLELLQLENDEEFPQTNEESNQNPSVENIKIPEVKKNTDHDNKASNHHISSGVQSMISVGVTKLDKLMDLVGEMVIAEAMVIQNPDLDGLELERFHKAANQLNKITDEIQDLVMSIRMVPLSTTFQKMNRIVRDMSKKLKKEVELRIIGEETEVDKNIIEHISDPLMHLVRNCVDHGLENPQERIAKGKIRSGVVTLEAKSAGNDVLIIVKDDGKGLDREKILKKAKENNIITQDTDEISDKEVFNLILLPGFSTKSDISEFSGRGVGMDVVKKNIEEIGGSIAVDSIPNQGTVITLKIPLTLAIIDGMITRVGKACYTIPTNSIRESFRPVENNIITDTNGNELIMVRGEFYPILRLHRHFNIETDRTDLTKGIIIMVEQDEKRLCIYTDELLGQQQVVVKALPEYIKRFKRVKGLAGCTLLGDGSISLILDITGLIAM